MKGVKIIKKVLLIIICSLLLFGCNKKNSKDVISDFKKNIDVPYYTITGEMDIVSNEELYHYNVTVNHLKDDFYKASLTNKDTNYEQIILKNDSGVYVVTPSLNKSFKYQSEWPFNSSQSYILESLLNDLNNDSNTILERKDNSYVIQSTVNYPNNSYLTSQKITFDENMLPTVVEVYNSDGIVNITFKISNIDFKNELFKEDFDVENTSCNDCVSDVSKIDETIYPMYLPEGTIFKGEETVNSEDTKRVILTFGGDKSFTLIEEVASLPSEFMINSTDSELVFYENVVGGLTESSLNWTMDGKDYYIISDNLSNEELLKIAASTSVASISK